MAFRCKTNKSKTCFNKKLEFDKQRVIIYRMHREIWLELEGRYSINYFDEFT